MSEAITLQPFQLRVVKELDELVIKADALRLFFKTEFFLQLDEAEKDRLTKQSFYMDSYADILKQRIAAFK